MLTPEQMEGLLCRGKLSFICCLTYPQFEVLAGYVSGMGPETRRRFYETACCQASTAAGSPPPASPAVACPPDAIDTLCSYLNQEWLEAAAALGAILETQVETGPFAIVAGLVSTAATAASALCFDKTVTDASKSALCTLMQYGSSLTSMAQEYPLVARVLNRMMDPHVLATLAKCCSVSTGP